MKKLHSPLITFLFLSALLVFACKKDDATDPHSEPASLSQQVGSWLDLQNSSAATSVGARIQSLMTHLDYSRVRTEELRNNEHFIVVPIKSGLTTVAPLTNAVNALVLVVNKSGQIRKGMIAQYVPEAGKLVDAIPENTFYAIYDFKRVDAGGQYRFLDLAGRYLYEFDYQDGKMSSYKFMRAKPQTKTPASLVINCTDYYVDAWIFYLNCAVEETEIYVGTVCDNGCALVDPTNSQSTLCGNGGGNVTYASQQGSPPALTPETTELTWTVASDPTIGYTVSSVEQFTGFAGDNIYGGGIFTSVTHEGSLASGNYLSWTEDATLTYLSLSPDGTTVTSNVGGPLVEPGRMPLTISIQGSTSFIAAQVLL